jgi:heat shock protein HslJ
MPGRTVATACAALAAAVALAAAPATAETRRLSGEVVVRHATDLPADALLLVEVHDPDGWVVVAQAQPLDGTPAFAFDVPDGLALSVRTALFAGGATWATAEPRTVRPGQAPVHLGAVAFTLRDGTPPQAAWRCGSRVVQVTPEGRDLWLGLPGRSLRLTPVETASGARHDGPEGTWFWEHGPSARASIDGTELPECSPAVPPAFLPFVARGSEPAWRLELAAGRAVLVTDLGATRADLALTRPAAEGAALVYRLGEDMTVRIVPALAGDPMTGMLHPYAVEVRMADTALAGVGGTPLALIEGDWRIVEAGGQPVAEGLEATLSISHRGAYAGRAACNRYAGQIVLGEVLDMGNPAATRMACDGPAMTAEAAIFAAFEATRGFRIAADGALALTDAAGTAVLVARR